MTSSDERRLAERLAAIDKLQRVALLRLLGIGSSWRTTPQLRALARMAVIRGGDEGGLSPRGARLLGFDAPCHHCGHDSGLHEAEGRCAVLGCECKRFAVQEIAAGKATPTIDK